MSETAAIIKWLCMCLMVSMLMRPYLRTRALCFIDGGFGMSFGLGTALSFFISWIASSLGMFKFDEHVYITFGIMALAPIAVLAAKMILGDGGCISFFGEPESGNSNRTGEYRRFFVGFFVFAAIFLMMVYVRGFKPEISSSTEQYMDYGFVQAIYRQRSALPEDIWYSGEPLNYYFLGQAATAYLCRLSFVTPEYGYYFMLNTIFAALLLMCFELVEAVLKMIPGDGGYISFLKNDRENGEGNGQKNDRGTVPRLKNRYIGIIGGFAASLSVCCASNGHYLIYGLILPLLEKITGESYRYRDIGYYFPDSTTYIGNFPETLDKGKNEFMAYSVVLGDLHAHVINTLFVLPLLAILVDYALGGLKRDDKGRLTGMIPGDGGCISFYTQCTALRNPSLTRHLRTKDGGCISFLCRSVIFVSKYINYTTVITGILLGLFMGSNFWDFPIYFVVAGALILFHDLSEAQSAGLVSELENDENVAEEKAQNDIKMICNPRPRVSKIVTSFCRVLIKGAVVFGIAELFAIPFNRNFVKMSSEIGLCVNHSPLYKLAVLWGLPIAVSVAALILLYRKKYCVPRRIKLMITAIAGCAIGLVLMPEIVYVKDIYGEKYARFNTMFKLTYQAFILFGLVMGLSVGLFIMYRKRTAAIITGIFVLVLSSYLPFATHQFMGNVLDVSRRSGSSCTDFLMEREELFPEMIAINVINQDEREHVHILEAGGTSYTPDNKLSVFTGACTYAGWGVHEWMWRGIWDPMGMRLGEVSFFYESGQKGYCRDFLTDNAIDYVFIGPREREKYAIDPEGFEDLLEEVFITEDGQYGLYRPRL